MIPDVCASNVLTIFIVIIVTIAVFSLVQNMIKSYYIKKEYRTMELYGGAIPATLVIKYIKKFPKILKNKSAQIKQLLNSLTDNQLNIVAKILEIDFNKLKTHKNNIVNKGVDVKTN